MSIRKPYDYLLKTVIIGDSGVGKSALMSRLCDDTFNENFISTIGVDFKYRELITVSGKVIKLQIWDTAGQERYRTITAAYYRGANCIAITFDVCSRDSFVKVQYWIGECKKYCSPDVKYVLIGAKADRIDRAVSKEEANSVALKYNIPYIESSAKTGDNVEEAFRILCNQCTEIPEKSVTLTISEPIRKTGPIFRC